MSQQSVLDIFREFELKGAPGVVIHDFTDGSGRGLLATKPIAAGQVVLSLPLSSFVTVNNALRNSTLKKPLSKYGKHGFNENDSILAFFLIYLRNQSRAKTTQWTEYYKLVPASFNNVLYFSEKETDLLKGSNVEILARKWKDQFVEDYQRLFTNFLFQSYPSMFKPTDFTLEDFRWAISLICTRAFDIKVAGEPVRAVIPGIDFLNHSFDAKCSHSFDEASNTMRVVATQPIEAGEQIFTNYGPIGNGRLVRVYGFATEVNPYTTVDIWATMDPSAKYYNRKQAALKKIGLDDKVPFSLSDKSDIPEKLIAMLYIQRCDDSKLLKGVEDSLAAVKGDETATIRYDSELRLQVLSQLVQALQDMINSYTSTNSEDDELLANPQLTYNARIAIMLRKDEKSIIAHHLTQLTLLTISSKSSMLDVD